MHHSGSSDELNRPKRLKTLASAVGYPGGDTLLHRFVLDNSDPNPSGSESFISSMLRSVLSSEVPANALNDDGYTALNLAVLKNNLLMVKMLLSCLASIDVDKTGRRGGALHLAAELGHSSTVQVLLSRGASIDKFTSDNETALCVAAGSRRLDVIKMLVSGGAGMNIVGENGSPLCYAASSGNLEAVQFLVSSGAEINLYHGKIRNALSYAAESGNLAIVDFLLSNGAYIDDEYGWSALCGAARKGHLDMIKFLFDRGADVEITVRTCIEFDNQFIHRFFEVRRNGRGESPLHWAAEKSSEILEFLVSNRADVNVQNEEGQTPLHIAVGAGNLETVKFLVRSRADVNAEDGDSETPLHYAARARSLEIVEILVSNHADVNARERNFDETPLHWALEHCNLEVSTFLINHGADVRAKDKYGSTPLHFAAGQKDVDIVKLLVSKGADLEAKDKYGSTPLHNATRLNNAQIIRVLRDSGANMLAKNKSGQTPFVPLSENRD